MDARDSVWAEVMGPESILRESLVKPIARLSHEHELDTPHWPFLVHADVEGVIDA